MKPSLSACLALVFAVLPLTAHALTPSQVFEQVKDSVVIIKTLDAKGEQTAPPQMPSQQPIFLRVLYHLFNF